MNEPAEGFRDALARDVLRATRARIEEKVFSLTCPVHGRKPRWKSVATTGTQADLTFDCCCETLAGMIRDALR